MYPTLAAGGEADGPDFTRPNCRAPKLNPSTGWEALFSPWQGRDTTSRTELSTVITPTYTSPPKARRVVLQAICTAPLEADMTKPADAQPGDLPHQGPAGAAGWAGRELQQGAPAQQEAHHPRRGQQLGQHGGHGGPGHPHVQQEDEDGVQHDVGRRPHEGGDHPHPAEALGVDEAVHPGAHHGQGGADEVDAQVGGGIGPGVVAGPEEEEQGPQEETCPSTVSTTEAASSMVRVLPMIRSALRRCPLSPGRWSTGGRPPCRTGW